jgi:hypothetical protein
MAMDQCLEEGRYRDCTEDGATMRRRAIPDVA